MQVLHIFVNFLKYQKKDTSFKWSPLFEIESPVVETLRDRRSSSSCVDLHIFWPQKRPFEALKSNFSIFARIFSQGRVGGRATHLLYIYLRDALRAFFLWVSRASGRPSVGVPRIGTAIYTNCTQKSGNDQIKWPNPCGPPLATSWQQTCFCARRISNTRMLSKFDAAEAAAPLQRGDPPYHKTPFL